jgi:L-aspartate oxidase
MAAHPISHSPAGCADIVIVGGGLAGLFCALRLAPRPVTLLTAAPIGEGASSVWAQGGIAAAVAEGDTAAAHARDTVAAGAGIVDEPLALSVAQEAAERVRDLLAYGVPFDRDLAGRLNVSREAAHSARRIVRVKGDTAGRAIMAALAAAVAETPSIRVIEGARVDDLLVAGRRVVGVRAAASTNGLTRILTIPARAVILATGGVGHLYAITTNPAEACGGGLAAAARAGAVIADAEFVQFHPTAIAIGRDPAPLATEALRGEGALLINRDGERFMQRTHPQAELAPRDIVARGVFAEIAAGRGAFLDARAAIGESFADRFPTVYAACVAGGVDPRRDPIPVAPAAHYHMGGIATDARGQTSLDGLWAIGEAASTGLHGANRLASNSLLEAVVFAARVARDVGDVDPVPASEPQGCEHVETASAPTSPSTEQALRSLMAADVGVIRDGDGLARALATIVAIERETSSPRLRNMATAALLIAAAAYRRRESRGAHARSDFPESDPTQAKRSFLTLGDARAIARAAMESHSRVPTTVR